MGCSKRPKYKNRQERKKKGWKETIKEMKGKKAEAQWDMEKLKMQEANKQKKHEITKIAHEKEMQWMEKKEEKKQQI